ncbi:EF-hand and coiled-coil domain-containing protein 1 isoform X4 [Serinus canaria]|uniref:EF-hand and coiled-coil domain-containing protein 1 isoform X4 n=1 Tax=Serinus canaria TaxID=9135 RepID=UPI0021CCE091|nr:EF-hand and coiled-coil domain-containing protein 1 isoform X4 [Serinus canaria]
MELMQSSRDGQIEEAIRFSQELEKELKSSQEALVSLGDCNRNLKREQAEMRRKVEEARHAVLNSLGKVKELEVRAKEVPHLQIHIQQLESQLQHYRSELERCQMAQQSSPEQQQQQQQQKQQQQQSSPEQQQQQSSSEQQQEQQEGAAVPGGTCGASVAPPGTANHAEEQLFRSVEGQAASDEEEEQWPGGHGKRILAKPPCCGSGCDEKTWRKLLSYLETTSSEGKDPVELSGTICPLAEQPELKGHQEKKLETSMEEVTDEGPLAWAAAAEGGGDRSAEDGAADAGDREGSAVPGGREAPGCSAASPTAPRLEHIKASPGENPAEHFGILP